MSRCEEDGCDEMVEAKIRTDVFKERRLCRTHAVELIESRGWLE